MHAKMPNGKKSQIFHGIVIFALPGALCIIGNPVSMARASKSGAAPAAVIPIPAIPGCSF